MNMNVSDWFGLLTTAFTIGGLVGSLFRNASVTARLTIAAVVTLASMIPLPVDTRPSAAMYVYALTGLLSVTTLTILTCCLFKFSVPNRRKRIAIAAFVTGVFLYGGEIGAIPFDLFQYGYLPLYALAFAVVGIVLSDTVGAVTIFVGCVLYALGIYDNYFTALLDPILWIAAAAFLLRRFVLHFKNKNATPSSVPASR